MDRRALGYLTPYWRRLSGVVAISLVSTVLALWLPYLTKSLVDQALSGRDGAARTRIVDGAVGMVQMALEQLSRNKVCELDEERKAQMVCNLLVVLCGERGTQPIVNAGTIHG